MRLFHTTTVRNLKSILKHGLLASKSRGKILAVWLHGVNLASWACRHMMARPGIDIDGLVRLSIDVPRSWLVRRGKGIYYCTRDIPASRIKAIARFGIVSTVPTGN